MRNLWYPKNKAEYMTVQRFAELGLSKGKDVGEREHDFRAHEKAGEAVKEEAAPAPVKMTAAEEAVSAYTLAVSLQLLVPPVQSNIDILTQDQNSPNASTPSSRP